VRSAPDAARRHAVRRRVATRLLVAGAVAALLFGCSAAGGAPKSTGAVNPGNWPAVRAQAHGQTVRWWMYGGDTRVNRYIDETVRPAAAKLGIVLQRVPVTDTADAVQRVLAEQLAGRRSGGSVDLIWINGANFAQGAGAGLWLRDWAPRLPNARYVDWSDPTIANDFGIPVAGQESPWSRAQFVLAYDSRRQREPPRSFQELLSYARAHPGRVTYPAPPDFTGSAFVRQAVQALGEGAAFALLRQLKPLQWRGGAAFPGSEAELDRLFGNGQVDFAMSYDPSFVLTGVRRGELPESTRPFVLSSGTLANTSYVTIPADAGHRAGALVVADLLLSPGLQAAKADPQQLGVPTVLDLSRLGGADQRLFAATKSSRYLLSDFGHQISELPAARVPALDARWKREVLR